MSDSPVATVLRLVDSSGGMYLVTMWHIVIYYDEMFDMFYAKIDHNSEKHWLFSNAKFTSFGSMIERALETTSEGIGVIDEALWEKFTTKFVAELIWNSL